MRLNEAPESLRGSGDREKSLAALRLLLARAHDRSARTSGRASLRFTFGAKRLDIRLGGGLSRAALHEVCAHGFVDWPAAAGFCAALALRAAQGRPVVWARQEVLEGEAGALNGAGLREFGIDPARLILVRAPNAEAVLRAGVEAARCKALGAAIVEIWGEPRALDLTASLRLSRAAEQSGATVFLLRALAVRRDALSRPSNSAAASRWLARAQNSSGSLANAPGDPCFALTLLRQRGGVGESFWRVEWSRDRQSFQEANDILAAPLPQPVSALSVDRSVEAGSGAGARSDETRDEAPLALVAKQGGTQRLYALNAAGSRLGLTPGLGLADARALCPGLPVRAADPTGDEKALIELAGFCETYTPLVGCDPPHGLTLDVSGCAHLFGGEDALRTKILVDMARLGLTACAALAGTPDAARALARFGAISPAGPAPITAIFLRVMSAFTKFRADMLSDTMSLNLTFIVEEAESGQRLDQFLAARPELIEASLSRTRIQSLIEAGEVSIDGAPAPSPKTKTRAGQSVTLTAPAATPAEPKGEDIPLAVRFEDSHLIVIDKPAGLVVHPGAGHETGTLVNALIAHCGDSLSGVGGVKRPGIVHRLDKDTSGLLVVAKTDAAHHGLSRLFADHGRKLSLTREYLAIVWGAPDRQAGAIDAPLGRHATQREKMAVVSEERGRQAVTHWRLVETFGPKNKPLASLIVCRLETGRTHQIRAHMAHIGHPLLGDSVYGSGFKTKAKLASAEAREALADLNRQALHAAVLGFEHPVTREELMFESQPPQDFANMLAALRN